MSHIHNHLRVFVSRRGRAPKRERQDVANEPGNQVSDADGEAPPVDPNGNEGPGSPRGQSPCGEETDRDDPSDGNDTHDDRPSGLSSGV